MAHAAVPARTRAPVAVLVVAAFAILVACSDDRPLHYLQSLPEDNLGYPDSTLTCRHVSPETPNLVGSISATSFRCYTAPASEDEVVAWYAEELATRGWRRLDHYYTGDGSPQMPQWLKGFAALQLDSINIDDPDATEPIDYTVSLIARDGSYDHAPVSRLLEAPEAALAYPGSSDRKVVEIGRRDGPAGAALIRRSYVTAASAAEVDQHFQTEMAARGWQAVDPGTKDTPLGYQPELVWQKDDLVAGLESSTIKPNASSDFMPTSYTFMLVEVLGPDHMVKRPW